MPSAMFVDTTLCTGCKACQVACKEWNGLEAEPKHFRQDQGMPYPVAVNFTGNSYDNTGRLGARNWRHVRFIEQINARRAGSRWLFMSDSCKHCTDAACLNVCPAEAIERTDLGNVIVRQDKCVGNKLCNKACPYGVVTYSEKTGTSHKCTLCNDRIHNGLSPACAKACMTGSIRFGDLAELKALANERLARLKSLGEPKPNIYGFAEAGGLKVFYLLRDDPAVYGLPEKPTVQQRRKFSSLGNPWSMLLAGLAALIAFRGRRAGRADDHPPEETG